MWTLFQDMYSGGRQKLNWQNIFIELPENEAKQYFIDHLHRDPENVTCCCCGADYAISVLQTLSEPWLKIYLQKARIIKQDEINTNRQS